MNPCTRQFVHTVDDRDLTEEVLDALRAVCHVAILPGKGGKATLHILAPEDAEAKITERLPRSATAVVACNVAGQRLKGTTCNRAAFLTACPERWKEVYDPKTGTTTSQREPDPTEVDLRHVWLGVGGPVETEEDKPPTGGIGATGGKA